MKKTILAIWLFCIGMTTTVLSQRCVRLPEALREISGLALSPGGQLWGLNDSGNEPLLYQIDPETGGVIQQIELPVPNRDWEELVISPDGQFYIGDFGNNRNQRRDLRIFKFDPKNNNIDSIHFRYADQQEFPPLSDQEKHFDCEAMIWYQDSLHLFTKCRFKGDGYSRHYVLPAQAGSYVLEVRDSVYLKNMVVTAASLSPDQSNFVLTGYYLGKKLGIIPFSCNSMCGFDIQQLHDGLGSGPVWRKRLPKFLAARQYESVCPDSDGHYWLVGNEGRGPQKMAIRSIRMFHSNSMKPAQK